MKKSTDLKSWMKECALMAGFLIAYVGSGVTSLNIFSETRTSAVFWPPSGLGMAIVLMGGPRYTFLVFAGSCVSGLISHTPWQLLLAYIPVNGLEALLGWLVVRRLWPIDLNLARAKDYILLILFVGAIVPIPGSFAAAAAIYSFNPSPISFLGHTLVWWMGGSLGIILLTPLILMWRSMPEGWTDKLRLAEAATMLVATAASCHFFRAEPYPLAFTSFIFVAWAAVRFGRRVTLLVTTVIVTQSIISAYTYAQPRDYANIWMFLVTLSTVGMTLATTLNERRTIIEAYRRAETARVKSDDALHRSAIDFQRLVETAEEGIWTIDTKGKTTFANHRMAAMLGVRPAAMLGKTFTDFMKPERHAAALELLNRRNEGIHEVHEFSLLHKEGHEIWILASTNPMTDIEGNVIGALAMITDITHFRKTERELRESEERFQKLFESSNDMIVIHQSGIVVAVNPATVRMIGASGPADLIGRNALNFVHPDDHPIVIDRLKKMNQGETQMPPLKERFIRFDKTTIDMMVAASLISYNGRTATMVIARQLP